MRFYRGWYFNGNDVDAITGCTKQEKVDGRDALIATKVLTPRSFACQIANPMLVALDTVELKRRCYVCYHAQNEPLALDLTRADDGRFDSFMACEGCEIVNFCSPECKDMAMKHVHKAECEVFQRLAPRIPPSNLRAVLRILLHQHRYPQFPQRHWDSLVSCKGYVDHFRKAGGKRWEDIVNLTQCAMEYSNTKEKFGTVLNMFCSLLMYGFPLQTRQFETIGIAMHPWIANLSHSCEPNSVIIFDPLKGGCDHRMQVVPLRNITRSEKITIAYVNGSIPLSLRKNELKTCHFFDCECTRCINQNGAPSELVTEEQLGALDKVRELVCAAEEDNTRHMPIQRLKYALHLLLMCSWRPEHYPFCFLLRKLISAYVDNKQYSLALGVALVLRRAAKSAYKKRSGCSHPVVLADMFTTLRLMDKVIEGEQWASQELDLADRGLDLVGFRSLWAETLRIKASRVQSWDFPQQDGFAYVERIRLVDSRAGDALKDSEKKRECMKPLDDLADEMLEELKRW